MPKTLIMSPERMERTLSRLAYEVIERNGGTDALSIIGIRQRGGAVAEALAARIGQVEGRTFQVGKLDVRAYRDDRDPNADIEDHSQVHGDVTGRDVLLVDDVLFTGRTARAALDALVHYGRPRTIQLMVLVDRGHREVPIQPDYVGRLLQTKHKERVVVAVGDGFSVYIEE